MLNLTLLAVSNKTMLLILMVVLIVLLVLLAVLGIVFIIALRKRQPVIKVVMAPQMTQPEAQPNGEQLALDGDVLPEEEPEPEAEEEEEPEAEEDATTYVTEGKDRVHYDRSFTAKIIQLSNDGKEWYTHVKNELLSYKGVKGRVSWKRETFRIGRAPVARFTVRGKTLCLMIAVDPAGFTGTKFSVEDVSNVASTADTPCLYRIKSARRAKYAKELIAAVMKELGIFKDPAFEPQDYYEGYEGDMGLMSKGLIKRVVTGSSRTFEVREINEAEAEAAAAEAENAGKEE